MRTLLVLLFLGLNTIFDIKLKKLPLVLLAGYALMAVVIDIFWPEHSAVEIFCGAVIGVVLVGLSCITEGQIGKGDGILFMVTGLFIGGIQNFSLLLWSTIICALVSGVLLLTKQVGRKDRIPFVPFVFLAYIGQVIL